MLLLHEKLGLIPRNAFIFILIFRSSDVLVPLKDSFYEDIIQWLWGHRRESCKHKSDLMQWPVEVKISSSNLAPSFFLSFSPSENSRCGESPRCRVSEVTPILVLRPTTRPRFLQRGRARLLETSESEDGGKAELLLCCTAGEGLLLFCLSIQCVWQRNLKLGSTEAEQTRNSLRRQETSNQAHETQN